MVRRLSEAKPQAKEFDNMPKREKAGKAYIAAGKKLVAALAAFEDALEDVEDAT